MSEQTVPRKRTTQQAADYFRRQDKVTLVTYWRIRNLVL
jgi:hypothetical protein